MSENVPAGWQIMPLKFATADFQNGVWGSEPNGGPDDILCARVADFDRVKLQVTDVPTVRRVSQKDRDRCSVQRGDILVEKSGGTYKNPVGTVVSYQGDLPAVYANFIFRVRMRSHQDQRFWLYALHASYLDGRTWSLVRQTTGIQNLDTNGFMSMKHPAPPIETQRHIADYLDRETGQINAMIDKLGELESDLALRKDSVVKTELIDEEHKYPRVPLQAIASIHSGDTISANKIEKTGEYPVYGGNGVRGFTKNYNESRNRVLIGRQGALCGNVHQAVAPFWASEHALVLSPYDDVDLRWLEYATRNLDLGRLSTSAAQPGITASGVGRERLPLPPLEEQRRIADHLDTVTSKIDAMLSKVGQLKDLLTERRAALITDVVTGRKDVA